MQFSKTPRSLASIGVRISHGFYAEDWMPAYAGMTTGASFPRKRESSMRRKDRELHDSGAEVVMQTAYNKTG